MQDIMIRIQTDDFEVWKEQHYLHAANRAAHPRAFRVGTRAGSPSRPSMAIT